MKTMTRYNKKFFAVSKVYDTAVMTDNEIELSIQKNLDAYVGKDKVDFKLSIQGRTLAMFFHRQVDYDELHANPEEDIIDVDTLMITGVGYNGFKMPVPLPPMPFIGYLTLLEDEDPLFLNIKLYFRIMNDIKKRVSIYYNASDSTSRDVKTIDEVIELVKKESCIISD